MTRFLKKDDCGGCVSSAHTKIAARAEGDNAVFARFGLQKIIAFATIATVAFSSHSATFQKFIPDLCRIHNISQLQATTENPTPAPGIREASNETLQEIERLDLHSDTLRRNQIFDGVYNSNFQYLSETHWHIAELRLMSFGLLDRSLYRMHKGSLVRFPIPPPTVAA